MWFLLSHVILVFKKNCLWTFLNIEVVDGIGNCCLSNWIWYLFYLYEFVKILFRFGGCRFQWINVMSLKLLFFSTSVFSPDFTKSKRFQLLGLKVLKKVKLLLFSIVSDWSSSVWGSFNAFGISMSTIFSG